MIKRAPFLRVAMAVGAAWFLARIAFSRSERRKAESALSASDSALAGKPNGRAKTRSILDLAGSLKSSVAGVSVDDMKAWRRPGTKARKGWRREESARLLRLARVLARAAEVFDDSELGLSWLKTPVTALGEVTPLSLVDTDIGADSVMDMLGRIEHGVFA